MPFRLVKFLALICLGLLLLWAGSLYRQVHHVKTPYLKSIDQADQLSLKQGPIQLMFHKEKQGWMVSGALNGPTYPVDDERWHTLDSALRDVQLEDVISDRAAHLEDFELDAAHGTQVTLRHAPSQVLADGIFGKQSADATHIYFCYPDQPTVYLARGLFRGELGGVDLAGWRNHNLVTLSEGQIEAFTIANATSVASLQKSSMTWQVNGAPADTDKVNTWIGAFAHLRADDFVDLQSTGAPSMNDLHNTTITVKSHDAQVVLSVGPLDKKGQRFPVSTATENGMAWISAPRMNALLLKPSDFQKK